MRSGADDHLYTPATIPVSYTHLDVYTRQDLDKNGVDFIPNDDETEKEPEVLPVKVPNLLINGAEGIAVGMATSCLLYTSKGCTCPCRKI